MITTTYWEVLSMLTITNWWGVFYAVIVPILIMIMLAYEAGREEGRIRYAKSNRVQYRKNNGRNSYTKRANCSKYNRNWQKASRSKK